MHLNENYEAFLKRWLAEGHTDRLVGVSTAETILGRSGQRIRYLCDHGRIPGATKLNDTPQLEQARKAGQHGAKGKGPGKTFPWAMPLSGLEWFKAQDRPAVKPQREDPTQGLPKAS